MRNLRRSLRAGISLLLPLSLSALLACQKPESEPVETPAAPIDVVDPAETAVQEGLAEAQRLLQQQDFPAAVAHLERLVQEAPDAGRAWGMLGFARHQVEDFSGAIEALAKAAEIEESRPQALYNLARAHARLGQPDEAFERLAEAEASGRVDMTRILLDGELQSLAEDPRWTALLPTEEEFSDPFVEDVRVLHEWRGEAPQDVFGWIARNIGDVDGDGIDDLTTSATGASQGAGKVYTYSSRSGDLLWAREGEAGAQLGIGIEAAGDVDGDGVPDVAAGAPGVGKTYVYGGRTGEVILTLEAAQDGENFGRKVSDVGDLDGDGRDDVLVGAPLNDAAGEDAGRAAVYSGKDGSILLEVFGEAAGDQLGSSGAGAHRQGKGLLVVGAPNAGEAQRGRAYVFRDGRSEPAFAIEADDTGAQLGGMFVSVIGDIDGDGEADVYASDWADGALGPTTGKIYVHSGRTGERLLTLSGEAAGDGFGIGPADAGDIDGDGHDDLIIGAWQHGSGAPSGGKVYLYSGRDGSLLRKITAKVPGDTFGFDTTGMGDIDGDGVIDFLLTSAWSSVNGARSGRMFLIAGEE